MEQQNWPLEVQSVDGCRAASGRREGDGELEFGKRARQLVDQRFELRELLSMRGLDDNGLGAGVLGDHPAEGRFEVHWSGEFQICILINDITNV